MKNKAPIEELLNSIQQEVENKWQLDLKSIASHYSEREIHQSLAIKILSIFGGVLASISFIGFIFLVGMMQSGFNYLLIGCIGIIAPIWSNNKQDKIILDTICICSFIIGFVFLGIGMSQFHVSDQIICFIFIGIAATTLFLIKNYILSFISILIANGCLITLIHINKILGALPVYTGFLSILLTFFLLKESKIIASRNMLAKLYQPLRIGLIVCFISALFVLCVHWILPFPGKHIWLSSIIIILNILYVITQLFQILNVSEMKNKIVIYILSLVILLATTYVPSISGSLLMILLCYLVNYKTGFVMGIVAFVYFICQYYYDLNFNLMTKSILLFSSGVFFLILFLITQKKLNTHEKV